MGLVWKRREGREGCKDGRNCVEIGSLGLQRGVKIAAIWTTKHKKHKKRKKKKKKKKEKRLRQ